MESFTYIDDYFKGLVQQQTDFEERLLTDNAFAEDVTFYLTLTQAARAQNDSIKKERFKKLYYETAPGKPAIPVKRLWPYTAAAAAVLTAIVFGLYLYRQPADPSKLAEEYISHQFHALEVQMGNTHDLLQSGIGYYNLQDYPAALKKFEQAIQSDTANYDAREDAGITALQMKDFDKALDYFKQVANTNKLAENHGIFYEALTLMKRNLPGDKEQSKILLKKVIEEKLYGEDDAKDYLKKLK